MEYFTSEITSNLLSENDIEKYREALRLYNIEYKKTKKLLPDEFTEIYENHKYFHDALVPEISLLSKYYNNEHHKFNEGLNKKVTSAAKLILVDADDYNLAWEIIIDDISGLNLRYFTDYPNIVNIGEFKYDELLNVDKKRISWEIEFSGGNLKVIFKKLSIKKLTDSEIRRYKE